MKRVGLLVVCVVALTGCGAPNKVDEYTDAAIRGCGKGNVAWVNAQEGRYGCRAGSFSHDH
jgi:hypothetical protein